MSAYNTKNYYSHFDFTEVEMGKFLYDTKSFIAGGFPLNVFLGEKLYPDSDLDIFVRIPYDKENLSGDKFKSGYFPYEELVKSKIDTVLTGKGYKFQSHSPKYNESFDDKDINEIEYHRCALSHYIKNIINYQKIVEATDKSPVKKTNIQIITLYDCSIEDFIDTFDLNICRLVLVGEWSNISFYHDIKLYLDGCELRDIKNKIINVYNPLYPSNLERRLNKYLDRGFLLHDIKTALNYDRKNFSPTKLHEFIDELDLKVIDYYTFSCSKKQHHKEREISSEEVIEKTTKSGLYPIPEDEVDVEIPPNN